MYVWPAFCQSQSPAASLPAFSGLAPAKSSSSLSLHPAASFMVSGGEITLIWSLMQENVNDVQCDNIYMIFLYDNAIKQRAKQMIRLWGEQNYIKMFIVSLWSTLFFHHLIVPFSLALSLSHFFCYISSNLLFAKKRKKKRGKKASIFLSPALFVVADIHLFKLAASVQSS